MIDQEIVKQARNADMKVFLETHCGFTFVERSDASRCLEHQSLSIKQDHISWYWHSRGTGGFGAIDWLMHIEKMSFRVAVETVLNTRPTAPPSIEKKLPGILTLPQKRSVPFQLYHYLCDRRRIHRGIVETLIQEEKLYEDWRGNVIFVGHDDTGAARFASLRGTYGDCQFRMDCANSDKRYGFHMDARNGSNRLYLFESPVDAMSHGSLSNIHTSDPVAWQRDFRLSLAGTSNMALPFFLNQHPDVHELIFCLDSDSAGRTAASRIAGEYAEKGYVTRLELPYYKDYNDELSHLS